MKKLKKTHRCWFCLALFSVFLLLTPYEGMATEKGSSLLLSKLLRHQDDAIKLGNMARRSQKVISAAEKAEILKKSPQLMGKSDDFIMGTKIITDFAAQGTKQARLIESLDNPISLMRLEKNLPNAWKHIDDISSTIASTKISLESLRKLPSLRVMPQETANKVSTILGNYKASAEACMDMLRRGGKKSMDIIEKLKKYLPESSTNKIALGLIAWHLVDPDGAEESIAAFFKEHVIPLATTPLKGSIDGISAELTQIDASTSGMLNTIKNLSFGTIGILLFVLIMCIKTVRRSIGALLALPFDFCTRKLRQMNPESKNKRTLKRNGSSSSFDTSKFNAALNRGSKCKIKK